MVLPLAERISLAQALWESIDAGLADTGEDAAVREAIRRDQELASGGYRPHSRSSHAGGAAHHRMRLIYHTSMPRWDFSKPRSLDLRRGWLNWRDRCTDGLEDPA
jgi:hypothetical protein